MEFGNLDLSKNQLYRIRVFDGKNEWRYENAKYYYNAQDKTFEVTTEDGRIITYFGNYTASVKANPN